MFALQHEETPIVDTFVGTLMITSYPAYASIDTSATHSCVSEEYLSTCCLVAKVIFDLAMCVNTPLGLGTLMTRIVRSIDVVVKNLHMPIDMFMLPMSNFDVVFGMKCLNRYHVTINYFNAILSLKM